GASAAESLPHSCSARSGPRPPRGVVGALPVARGPCARARKNRTFRAPPVIEGEGPVVGWRLHRHPPARRPLPASPSRAARKIAGADVSRERTRGGAKRLGGKLPETRAAVTHSAVHEASGDVECDLVEASGLP